MVRRNKKLKTQIAVLIQQIIRNPCAALMNGHPAVHDLARHGGRAVLPVLKAMQGPVPPGQHARDMVEALGAVLHAIAKRDSAPLLQILRRDDIPADPQLIMLVSAMSAGRKARVVEPLLRLLKHENPLVRWCAATSLVQLRTKKAVAPLTAALRDRSPMVFGAVIQAMSNSRFYRNAAAIEPLRRIVQRQRIRKDLPGLWREAQSVLAELEAQA